MDQSVFSFDDYKAYVKARIASSANGGRGLRRKLAEVCACQVAYVSHVLAGNKHFSLEQAEATTRFFRLRDDEAEFFLFLVEHARASTPELRRYFDRQLESRRRAYLEIKSRIRIESTISPEDQSTYYSSWHYQAVRTAMTLEGHHSAESLSRRLNLSIERTNEILLYLLGKGLAKETAKGYQATDRHIHLSRQSPLISQLHSNWRVRTLTALEHIKPDDYHYSGLVTLSRKDFKTVREILTNALADAVEVIKPSREEKLCLLAMDFFEL